MHKGPLPTNFDEFRGLRAHINIHEMFYFDVDACNTADEIGDVIDACATDYQISNKTKDLLRTLIIDD